MPEPDERAQNNELEPLRRSFKRLTGSSVAVILAGGRAQRMGGGDKALLQIGTQTILARTLAALAPCPTALNAQGDPARFAPHTLPILPDAGPGHQGPLAGILAAMRWAAAYTHVLTVPGDCPFLPHDLLARMETGAPGIVMAASAGRTHHATALWPTNLHDDLAAALQAGQRRVEAYAAPHGITIVEWPATPFDPFLNVNTPQDLAYARTLIPPSATAPPTDAPPPPPPG